MAEPVLLALGPLPWVSKSLFLASLLPLAAWGETFCHVWYSGPGKRGILDTSGFLACRNVEGSDSLGLGLKKWSQLISSWAYMETAFLGSRAAAAEGRLSGAGERASPWGSLRSRGTTCLGRLWPGLLPSLVSQVPSAGHLVLPSWRFLAH